MVIGPKCNAHLWVRQKRCLSLSSLCWCPLAYGGKVPIRPSLAQFRRRTYCNEQLVSRNNPTDRTIEVWHKSSSNSSDTSKQRERENCIIISPDSHTLSIRDDGRLIKKRVTFFFSSTLANPHTIPFRSFEKKEKLVVLCGRGKRDTRENISQKKTYRVQREPMGREVKNIKIEKKLHKST